MLKENKNLFYKLIYFLKFIKLEILKIYNKTNLINKFIKLFKIFIRVYIFVNYKSNKNFIFILIIKILIILY